MTAATCGWVTMSMRELDRLKVIEAIIEGRLKPAAAAQRLRLTTRQVHRLVLRYREDGPAGLAWGYAEIRQKLGHSLCKSMILMVIL
ncbi:helix-turn-helix domain-containing protein [Pseudomonas aeruginosa]|uniref:helix-turn-helix domain-containing protein n=1 Tax=Pseudomonas aeruginosa TaxID=287 RepID=UPI00071BBB82|nr:helix-turn-helix domain-containing protein [Pseudomonas aeruginosa]